ncbi:flagellar hook assembly protein FlgD [Aestuariibacter sp. A3R04]|uniref:flagellar hook assembly protein FlgD n=1 Tax=Aestuariibacter sp. A3R04 TaxID=2841571 RepID=UPI001C0A1C39|nr:flagellar hook capping FlgD N-terminal domain-containing protein [Aestuariibacter sp. A3R04]MBU3023144.1 LfgD [Aestuariibacter sp. A3R04]
MNVDSTSVYTNTVNNNQTIVGNNASGEDLSNMFLELLVAQISHQNPLDPLDGTEYVNQLAEFSNVESLQSISQNTSASLDYMDSLMVLETTSMVGKQVDVQTDAIALEQQGDINGTINLPYSADAVVVQLFNLDGDLVEQQQLAYSGVGSLSFGFENQSAGRYQVRAYSTVDGVPNSLDPWLKGEVERVSVGSSVNDISLQVNGLGNFSLSDINQLANQG